jgi:hypothetical protein
MSPFVIMRVNGREERRSEFVEQGGKHPVWNHQVFEWQMFNLDDELFIEVRDRDMIGSQFLG